MRLTVALFVSGILVASYAVADARGLGRFASGLARGAIQGGAHAGVRYAVKTYTADVMTVDQLVICLKRADALDGESEQIEVKRTALEAGSKELDLMADRVDQQRRSVDTRVKRQIDSF